VVWVSQVSVVKQNTLFSNFTAPHKVDAPNPAIFLLFEEVEIPISDLVHRSLVLGHFLVLLYFLFFRLF